MTTTFHNNLEHRWLTYFDNWTLQKGRDYFRRGMVLDVDFNVGDDFEIVGHVRGSGRNRYSVAAALSEDSSSIADTICSCPLGGDCKHTAALVMEYLRAGLAAGGSPARGLARIRMSKSLSAKLAAYDRLAADGDFVPSASSDGDSLEDDAGARESMLSGSAGAITVLTDGDYERDCLAENSPPDRFGAVSFSAEPVGNESQAAPPLSGGPGASSIASPPPTGFVKRVVLKPPGAGVAHALQRLEHLWRAESASSPLGPNKPTEQSKPRNVLLYILKSQQSSSRPYIELVKVSLKKDGTFGTPSNVRLDTLLHYNPPAYVTPSDQDIAKLWKTTALHGSHSSYYYGQSYLDTDPKLLAVLMTAILETGRCYFESAANPPLKLGRALEGAVAWKEFGDHQTLSVVAAVGDRQLDCLQWKFPWYVDRSTWTCGPVWLPCSATMLEAVLSMPPVALEEIPAVSMALTEKGLSEIIPLPRGHGGVEVQVVTPVPSLEVESVKCQTPLFLGHSIWRPGDDLKTVVLSTLPDGPVDVPYTDATGKLILRKLDRNAEKAYVQRLEDCGFHEIRPESVRETKRAGRRFVLPKAVNWAEFAADELPALRSEGWQVSKRSELSMLPVALSEADLNIQISDGDDWWFSMALAIEVGGRKIPLLPILISAIRTLPSFEKITDEAIETLNHDGKFISALPDGQLISLPFDRIRSILRSLSEVIWKEIEPKALRVSVLDASELLDTSKLKMARWVGAERVLQLVERLKQLHSVPQVQAPKKLKTQLRPYQLDGLSWLQLLSQQEFGGILADDMGLGKTVQLLAHICLEKQSGRLDRPYLVVCPTSVVPNWLAECARFAPHLKVLPLVGKDRSSRFQDITEHDLVITTYPLITRDQSALSWVAWHGVALDEAQAIKNHNTAMAEAAGKLKARHRFCMTGTPIENHLGELWSQFNFLMPGLLGDVKTFNSCMRNPIEKEGDVQRKIILANRVRPFILRRTKSEVAADLPEKTTIVKTVELDGPQRDLYEAVRLASTKQIRDEIAQKGFKKSQIMILDALLKLRQACCDPRLVKVSAAKKAKKSAKLDALIEMLEELAEAKRKILVFSQFTSMLDLIAEELNNKRIKYVELRGDTKDRVIPVKRFQNGDVPVFLISLKAGGTGLNLTAADTVIHYDPWWNPAVEEQATDRAHRIGQTKNVFVYKLIAQGTIEQRMLELQERKRTLAKGIIDGGAEQTLKFSETDLENLLRPIDELAGE